MFETTQRLYADLAKTLGVDALEPDAHGTLQLQVGDDSTVIIFAENASSVMLVSPVVPLPTDVEFGRTLWLLQRNFYEGPLAPFRIACDKSGRINIWGRVPTVGLTGLELAKLIDAVAVESDFIRAEIETDSAAEIPR